MCPAPSIDDPEKISPPNPRAVPVRTLLKGTSIIMIAPLMLLVIFSLYGVLDPRWAILGAFGLFIVSIFFVWPYIANLSALTFYVEQLTLDRKSDPPDLTFLNNVEALSEAVERLQLSWNVRKNQLESLLAESKVLIDSLPDILIMLDKNLNIVRTNSTLELSFGKRHRETTRFILENSEIKSLISEVTKDGKGRDLEFSMSEPISRDYIVHVERLVSFSPSGIAIIIALHDVTQLKRSEQTFADFVANASHEIRTPLTSLMGFIETLQTTARDDTEAQEKFLGIMHEQAEKMNRLVRDLLSLSKIERSSTTLPREKVKISRILKEVVEQSNWDVKNRKAKFNLEFEKNLPLITGDKEELAQAFNNIISNALKYGKENGKVTITADITENNLPEEKRLRNVEKLLVVSISDEGEGIAKKDIPRLTERFYRASSARSEKIEGSGLGLSIVSHVLERHNGVLKIESKKNKGSKFSVILPVS